MKKFLFFLIIIGIGIFCYFNFFNKDSIDYIIDTEYSADVDELYIYGTRLNISGSADVSSINKVDDIKLLFNGSYKIEINVNYDIEENRVLFYLSDVINDGFNLEKYDLDSSYMYLEVFSNDDVFYYKLDNKTKYKSTDYYFINKDKKLNISSKNDTLYLFNSNCSSKMYDFVIDPGHGGYDIGACANGICEVDFTYKISSEIKLFLEDKGFSVLLTRDELSDDEQLSNYGKDGRVNIANDSHAKYLISVHLNSNDYNDSGLEIYTANNINYNFARKMAANIKNFADTKFSSNSSFRVEPGIYTRTLQNIDLKEDIDIANRGGYEPYDISLNTTYYFIIRETGGYMSGAYKDGRDGKPYNFSYNSNVGIESYLVELGYVTSSSDVSNIKKNYKKYAEGIAQSLIDEVSG